MPASKKFWDDMQSIKNNLVYSIQDFFCEVQLGIKDNLTGIKFLFLHPTISAKHIISGWLHPIKRFKKLSKFASENPTRYWTNLFLSYLEARAITAVVPNINVLQDFYDLGNDVMPGTLRNVLHHNRLVLFAVPEKNEQNNLEDSTNSTAKIDSPRISGRF